LDRQARDVAARARKTGDEPGANRIVPQDKDDGDDRGRLLYCWGRAVVGNNGIDVEPDELDRDLGDALGASL
jgi:hypothetical protein